MSSDAYAPLPFLPEVLRCGPDFVELMIFGTKPGFIILHCEMNTAPSVIGWVLVLTDLPNVCEAKVEAAHLSAFVEMAVWLGVPMDLLPSRHLN